VFAEASQGGVGTIIHCAFPSSRPRDQAHEWRRDATDLTRQLLDIPHRRFIYISTVDAYPSLSGPALEGDSVDEDQARSPYAATKIACEVMVRQRAQGAVILRPGAMLGKHMRPNTTLRILDGDEGPYSLSGLSSMSYVLHEDIVGFVRAALAQDIHGTFNLCTSPTITLERVAALAGCSPSFGDFVYSVGQPTSATAAAILPILGQSSEDTLRRFMEAR
jgi:nucleoside-diphosphate-sugar epimerase